MSVFKYFVTTQLTIKYYLPLFYGTVETKILIDINSYHMDMDPEINHEVPLISLLQNVPSPFVNFYVLHLYIMASCISLYSYS